MTSCTGVVALHTRLPSTSHPCLVFAVSRDNFYRIFRDFSFTTPVGHCLCFVQTSLHPSCILGCPVTFSFLNRVTPGPLILCVAHSVQFTLLPVAIPILSYPTLSIHLLFPVSFYFSWCISYHLHKNSLGLLLPIPVPRPHNYVFLFVFSFIS